MTRPSPIRSSSYAAAGNNRYETEGLTGLTTEATARGFIVAYPDHLRLSLPVLGELATILRARRQEIVYR